VQSERFPVANAEFSRGNYRLVGGSCSWLSYPLDLCTVFLIPMSLSDVILN
jgi:hypothetical protein